MSLGWLHQRTLGNACLQPDDACLLPPTTYGRKCNAGAFYSRRPLIVFKVRFLKLGPSPGAFYFQGAGASSLMSFLIHDLPRDAFQEARGLMTGHQEHIGEGIIREF